MRTGTGSVAALAIGGLLLIGCNGEGEPEEGQTDPTSQEEGAEDVGGGEEGSAETEPAEGDTAAPEEAADASEDDAAAGPAGTVTLDGASVELDEAYWCEDYESAAGQTDMRVVGIAHDTIALDAGAYTSDDGVVLDAVTIWEVEGLDRGLGGTQVVAVEEGEDGYPWIQVDGQEVSIDGAYQGEDDPDGEEAVFSAELTVEQEPRGSAFC